MDEVKATMYVTKWWATRGIVKLNGRLFEAPLGGSFFSAPYLFARIGTHAFATEGEAQERVRKAAEKKRTSLLAQADKLDEIIFSGIQVVNGLK